jgi:hypothetical protein
MLRRFAKLMADRSVRPNPWIRLQSGNLQSAICGSVRLAKVPVSEATMVEDDDYDTIAEVHPALRLIKV